MLQYKVEIFGDLPISGLSPLTCLKHLSIVRWNLFPLYQPRSWDPYWWSFPNQARSALTHYTNCSSIVQRFSSSARAQHLDYRLYQPSFVWSLWLRSAWAGKKRDAYFRRLSVDIAETRLVNTAISTYINPLFAGKHCDELGIRFERLKIVLIVDFCAIWIQMYVRYVGFSELLRRFGFDFFQCSSNNAFATSSCDVLNLCPRGCHQM